ncbi:hypothetical protein BD413DRAFT_614247 [Trametes elegans]|nr:hypothetical protein BD413DRAFT_614247 [Trametes elegans]
MHEFYVWNDPLQGVHYSPGHVKSAIPKLLEQFGAKKALIVTISTTRMRASRPRKTLYRQLIPPMVKYLACVPPADLFKYLPASKADPTVPDIRQKLQISS